MFITALFQTVTKVTIRNNLIDLSRALGHQICRVRECRYHYPGGACCTWYAYACVRCGELDRPLDSLAPMPDDDYYDDLWYYDPGRAQAEADYARRWFRWLPWPRWL